MAYEIPQQLEYKEKIMFGLTFRQLAYAFLFGSIALMFFTRLDGITRYILAGIPSILGSLFMFFNFDEFLKNYIKYFKFKKIYSGNPKLEKFIGLKEIKDDAIITADKKKLAIIKVSPINFSIKPEGEQEVLLQVFQKFLNSIEFPVQILMNTESLQIKDYLNLLSERVKDYKELFKDYKSFINKTISKNSVRDRGFYLIIPETTNINIQTKICIQQLEQLNLKVERLNNKELKKLLIKSFYGNGKGSLIESVIPESIINHSDYLEVNNQFNRIITAYGYPRIVEAGFLDKIVSSFGNFDLSLHIIPFPIETMMINLNKELQKQRADLYSAQIKQIINPSLEIKYQDTRKILEELQKGKDKLFNISLYINCKADSLEELELLTNKVKSELNSLMIIPKIPIFRMIQGFKSCMPLAIDNLNINRNITTYSLSAFFPFTSPFFQVDDSGIWLGLNKNNIPIIRDIFKLPNPNGLVLSQSGGGKSFFCKLLISRYLLNNVKVMVIDPQGEYRNLVKQFNGQLIKLSRTSKTIINPLDLMGHDYSEKRLSLMDLMPVLLGDLSEPQKSFIDRAITQAYRRKGIREESSTWKKKPPILKDILKVLKEMEKSAITLEKTTIRSLINRLSMYVDGVFSFLNKQTNINFNNKFVCFDIGNLPKQVKPVMMFLVLDYVYMKMRKDIERKILLIDEAWSLLSRTEDATYIFEIVKTSRKFNLGLLLINQEVEGMLNSEAGKSVLANSSYTLLMRQKPAVINDVCETFHLSRTERNNLLTCAIGEGILIMEDEHTEIKIIASDEEHKLITTNPDELLKKKKPKKKKEEVKKKQEEVNITLDENKGFYKHKNLSLDEIKYLIAEGYKETIQYSINSNRKERFLVKTRNNESTQHFFLIYDIALYLKKFTNKISLFETKKPDIVFKINNKKYAIEIETGKVLKLAKKQLAKKVELLNKNYDDWFFVLTDRNFTSKYKEFGKVLDKRFLTNYFAKLFKKRQKQIPRV